MASRPLAGERQIQLLASRGRQARRTGILAVITLLSFREPLWTLELSWSRQLYQVSSQAELMQSELFESAVS